LRTELAAGNERIGALDQRLSSEATALASLTGEVARRGERLDSLLHSSADWGQRLLAAEEGLQLVAGGSRQVTIELETVAAAADLRLQAIETTFAERDRRLTGLETTASAAEVKFAAIGAEFGKLAVLDSQLADMHAALQKGLRATALLEGIVESVDADMADIRLTVLQTRTQQAA
jgi:hypothetical protein